MTEGLPVWLHNCLKILCPGVLSMIFSADYTDGYGGQYGNSAGRIRMYIPFFTGKHAA